MTNELTHLRNFPPLTRQFDEKGNELTLRMSNERFVKIAWGAMRRSFPLPKGMAEGPSVPALVNQNRWIVLCPFCAGAELADPNDHRFYCLACANEEAGHKWLPVEWPEDRDGIEEALLKRDSFKTRNWHPGETKEDLEAETEAWTSGQRRELNPAEAASFLGGAGAALAAEATIENEGD